MVGDEEERNGHKKGRYITSYENEKADVHVDVSHGSKNSDLMEA